MAKQSLGERPVGAGLREPLASPRNDFDQWIHITMWSTRALAMRLEMGRRIIDELRAGERSPTVIEAAKIEELTGGYVTIPSWLRSKSNRAA